MSVPSEWLDFVKMPKRPERKTDRYAVVSKGTGDVLGEVKWKSEWRHFCFFPTTRTETAHSDRCLADISHFVSGLNEEHRQLSKSSKS